jgi:hypothetical protein
VSKYDLHKLNEREFERLIQSLLKMIIGNGTTTFGSGPDGGREATYSGNAPYPSETNNWSGEWIFQAKYHDIYVIGPRQAQKELVKELKEEINKMIKRGISLNNYILATNVPLSSTYLSGTHDKILNIISEYKDRIQNIQVWGYDEICRYLDQSPEIRKAFPILMTQADFIQKNLDNAKRNHQNDDIRPILECWSKASIYLTRDVYRSNYSPFFLDLYVSINNFEGCDPYEEAIQHLENGYPNIHSQIGWILSTVDQHNNNVSNYAINLNEKIRTGISRTMPQLRECDVNSHLTFNSYYLMSIRRHFGNAYPDNRTKLQIKKEGQNNVSIFYLYSGPNGVGMGDEVNMKALQNLIQQLTPIVFEEIRGFEESIKSIQNLLDNFGKDIKPLIPKAKYGILAGQCEFEKNNQ